MENKKLKKIMTDLAAGHISQEEADKLLIERGKRLNQLKIENGRKKKSNLKEKKLNKKGGKTKSHKYTRAAQGQ